MLWIPLAAAAICGLSGLVFNDEGDTWGDRFQMAGIIAGTVLLMFFGLEFIVWLFG